MIAKLRARLAPAGDEGVTFIEVMVVVFLSTLLLTAVASMFANVSQQAVAAQGIRLSTGDASNISNVVSTTIRASVNNAVSGSDIPDPAVVSATATSLTVISYTDAGPSFQTPLQIRYRLVNGAMTEDRWVPTIVGGYAVFPSTNTAPNQSRVLGNVVVNSSLEPIFTYFGADIDDPPLDPGTTGLVAADRASVRFVAFDVKVRAINSHQIVELQDTIGMPNLALTDG